MSNRRIFILSSILVVATTAILGIYATIAMAIIQVLREPVSTVQYTAPATETVKLDKQHIYELINEERNIAGLDMLTTNTMLEISACAKAQHMLDNNYWAHTAPDGTLPWFFFAESGYMYNSAGENLGYGTQTDNDLVQSWMNSPGHKANILAGYYKESGLCVIQDVEFRGSKSTNLIVHHFGTPK